MRGMHREVEDDDVFLFIEIYLSKYWIQSKVILLSVQPFAEVLIT